MTVPCDFLSSDEPRTSSNNISSVSLAVIVDSNHIMSSFVYSADNRAE